MNTENKSKNTIEKSEYATKYVFRERGITVRQFAYVFGAKEESSYLINQLHVTNIGDTTPPYIAKKTTKKKKPKTPNSDQKRIQKQI